MGSAVCSWVRLICVECQLIMSLLLTPYVEFFMLSLTSRLNTDKFCVNLRTEGGGGGGQVQPGAFNNLYGTTTVPAD